MFYPIFTCASWHPDELRSLLAKLHNKETLEKIEYLIRLVSFVDLDTLKNEVEKLEFLNKIKTGESADIDIDFRNTVREISDLFTNVETISNASNNNMRDISNILRSLDARLTDLENRV